MEDNFLINDDNLQKLYGIAQSKGMPDSYEDLKSYLSASEENRRKFYDKLSSMGMPDSYEQYSAYIGQSAPAPQRTDVSDVQQAEQANVPVSEVATQPQATAMEPSALPTQQTEQPTEEQPKPAWMPNRMGGVGGEQNYMPQQTNYIERSKQEQKKVLNEEETAKIETLNNLDNTLGEIKQKRRQGFWKTVGGMFGDLAISGAMAEGGMSYEDQEQLRKVQDDIRKTNSVNMAINQNLHDAENTINIARKNIEEGEGSVAVKLGRGVRYANLDNMIPVSELYGQMGVLQLYDKLNEDGTPKEPLTEDEQTLYEALALNQYAQQAFGGDINMLNRIGKGLPEQAMFTLSFLLSSEFAGAQAIGKGATKALQRGISKGIKREIKTNLGKFMLDKALPTAFGMGAETLYRTGLQAGNIAEGAIERHVGNIRIDPETGEIGGFENGVDWGEAVWKSAASVANENATELLGDKVFEPGWAWLGRNTKAGKKIADFRKAIGKMGNGKVDDILKMGNSISEKAGWQGWAFETLEELAGNFNDAAFIHDQTWEQAFSKETLMETTLNCMIFGMAMGTSTTSLQALRNMPSAVETRNTKRLASSIIGRMDDISTDEIDQHIENDNTNDLSQWLVAKYDQGGWTDAQRAAVANYVRATVAQKAQRNFKDMQLQEEVNAMEERVDDMTNRQSGDVIEANFMVDGQMQTGTIVGGRVSVMENDVMDADGNPKQAYVYNPNLSSVTVTVRMEDGTKKQISARDIESINSVTDAEQYKAERTQELTQAMQDSVKAMYEPPTLSEIWGVDLQPGVMLTINGENWIITKHFDDGRWGFTSANPDGTPNGQSGMVMSDSDLRTAGLLERLNAMQQQGASEEEMDDVVSDLNAEEGLKNIEASDNEDNIWDAVAGFMQGYFKTNEEGDPIPEESRPEAVAGYLVALQKGDIGKTIGIVDARIAELQTRLMAKPEQVENNGEGVVGMAANQSLADSAAEDIKKEIGFLEMVREGLVAKQEEQAQMKAQQPVSQMEAGTEFPVDWNGTPAVAVVEGRDADGRNLVTVYDANDRDGLPLQAGIEVSENDDAEWEARRVMPESPQPPLEGGEPPMEQPPVDGTDRTDGTDNVPQPQPQPEPTPTPTPNPEPAPQQEQPQAEYPKDKQGKPQYDMIDDPNVFLQALVDEWGEDALGALNDIIEDTREGLEQKSKLEQRRINKRLAMLEAVRGMMQPQEEISGNQGNVSPVSTETPEQPAAETSGLQGLDGYSESDIEGLVRQHIESVLEGSDADIEIVGIKVIGSRTNGTANEGSDLDVLVEYKGDATEDGLFNLFNDEENRLYIEGVPVDINPITEGKSGTIEQFMARNEGYKKPAEEAPAETPMESAGEGTEQTGEPEQAPEQPAESVPDWTEDTAKAARERGYRMVDGERVDRQEPIDGVEGNEVEVKFSDTEKPKGKWKVVEAESLQPSHRNKRRNPRFFITEAQPKERKDNASDEASTKIAKDINPEEVMQGVTAYSGSPVINSRGEVIQGNNRTIGMQKMYESYPDSQEKYKQALMDKAEQMGLDKDAIGKMQHPVLVRSVDVDDDTAIKLGQKTSQDTESGGKQRMGASQVRNSLGDKYGRLVEMLFADTTDEEGIGEAIARNGVTALKYLWNQKAINNTQYQSALENGDLTAEAKEDFRNIIMESLFDGGPDGLRAAFNSLPAKSQNAILQTIYRDAKSNDESKIIGEVQQAIMAFANLMSFSQFALAKNQKEVENAVAAWLAQTNMFSDENNSEKYSNFALELAKRFKWQTLAGQRALFNDLFDKLQGVASEGLSMFEEVQQLGFAEAIKAVYGIDYLKPQRNNGISGSNDLADDNGLGQEGQQGGTGATESGERAESGERPANDRGGDERADREGQENQSGEKTSIEERKQALIERLNGKIKTKDEAWRIVSAAEELLSEYRGLPWDEYKYEQYSSYDINKIKGIAQQLLDKIGEPIQEATEKQVNYINKLADENDKKLLEGLKLNKFQASRIIELLKDMQDVVYSTGNEGFGLLEDLENEFKEVCDYIRKIQGKSETNVETQQVEEAVEKEITLDEIRNAWENGFDGIDEETLDAYYQWLLKNANDEESNRILDDMNDLLGIEDEAEEEEEQEKETPTNEEPKPKQEKKTKEQLEQERRDDILSLKDPLTEEEIRNSSEDEMIKENALSYLNGDRGVMAANCYLIIYDNVRNVTTGAERSSGTTDQPQLDAEDNGDKEPGESGQGGRGTGELGGEPSDTGRQGDGQEDNNGGVADTDGEGSLQEVEGNKPQKSNNPSSNPSRRGGSRGNRGASVDGNGGREVGREDSNANADDGGENARDSLQDALDEFGDLLDDLTKENQAIRRRNQGILYANPIGANMSMEKLKLWAKLTVAGAKVGYELIKKGITKFADWSKQMNTLLSAKLTNAFGWDKAGVDQYILELWNSKLPIDGETHTVAEWASIMGKKKIREAISESLKVKAEKQAKAENIEAKPADIDNINATLPFLLPEQRDDVLKAETQFFTEAHQDREHGYGKGYLFTNGTGTGKTYTGLGIIKRFVKMGKGRVLLVVPSEKKESDWINSGKNLLLDIHSLRDDKYWDDGKSSTQRSGKGIVVTTDAAFRENFELLKDNFDLVVYDESHRIMSSNDANSTRYLDHHFMLTLKDAEAATQRAIAVSPEMEEHRANAKELDTIRKALAKNERLKNKIESGNGTQSDLDKLLSEQEENDLMHKAQQLDFRNASIIADIEARKSEFEQKGKAFMDAKQPKVVFLSATPFNTVDSMKYAEGYIFSYPEGDKNGELFKTQYFPSSFQSRHGKVQQSVVDAVQAEREEINFSERLQHELETMSGRIIENGYDYSRHFPTLTNEYATMFNEAVQRITSFAGYQPLYKAMYDTFLKGAGFAPALLETLKVALIIPRIKQHIAMGRKVVVFHRRRNSQEPPSPPFERMLNKAMMEATTPQERAAVKSAVDQFRKEFSQLLAYEQTLNYDMILTQFSDEFGNQVAFFNGDVKETEQENSEEEKKNVSSIDAFNQHGGKTKIIVVQEASGKEGIDLHDTFGDEMRVEINLSLPQNPLTMLQIMGRIFRIGQKSNAVFEYPLIGLDFELMTFGSNMNQAVGTAENLALGDLSRGLRQALANGVLENSGEVPLEGQGVGGVEYDRRTQEEGSYEKAMSDYYKAKAQKFPDTNATPEALGYKMVEWAGLGESDEVLEPSAGHGAIARYVPQGNSLTAIEPNISLMAGLQLRASGRTRDFKNQTFETLDIINKYNVVLMNSQHQGQSSGSADIVKAYQHLREGGRMVVVANEESVAMAKSKMPNAVLVGKVKLPSFTFGDNVADENGKVVNDYSKASVYIFDIASRNETREEAKKKYKEVDLSDAKNIGELFANLKDVKMPERTIDDAAIDTLNAGKTWPRFKKLTRVFWDEQSTFSDTRMIVLARTVGKKAYRYTKKLDIEYKALRNNPRQAIRLYQDFKNSFNEYENAAREYAEQEARGEKVNKQRAEWTGEMADFCELSMRTILNVMRVNSEEQLIRLAEEHEANRARQLRETVQKMKENVGQTSSSVLNNAARNETIRDYIQTYLDTRGAYGGGRDRLKRTLTSFIYGELKRSYLEPQGYQWGDVDWTSKNEIEDLVEQEVNDYIDRIDNGFDPLNVKESISDFEKEKEYDIEDIRQYFYNLIGDNKDLRTLFDKVVKVSSMFGYKFKFTDMLDKQPSVMGDTNFTGLIRLKDSLFRQGADKTKQANVILHEMIHSSLIYATLIRTYDKAKYPTLGLFMDNLAQRMSPEMNEAVDELLSLFNTLKIDKRFTRRDGGLEDYGAFTPDEMIAELANPMFRAKLKAKRVWKKVVNAIAKFFGAQTKEAEESDALVELEKILDKFLNNADKSLYNDVKNMLQLGGYANESLNSEDILYRSSDELFEQYPTWLSGQTTDTGQHTTQITSTVKTYEHIGDWMKEQGMDGAKVLDASSGLGTGTFALRDMGFDVDDVEPYPSEKRETPTYTRYEDVDGEYDVVISNAVLNVIPDDWRADVLKSMADKVKVGGKLIINVRDAKSIESQKQKIELDSPSEILVTDSKGNIRAYQKGFTKQELKQYVEDELGEGWQVEIANEKNSGLKSGTAVVVTRTSEAKPLQYREIEREYKAGEMLPITKGNDGYRVEGLNDSYPNVDRLLDAWRDAHPDYFAEIRDGKLYVEPWNLGEGRTAKERRHNQATAERQWRRAHERANDTIKKLGLQDRVTILDSTEGLTGKRKKAKGWFDPKTGKIVIVMPNHNSPRDVVKTILHEGVAHYGLRKLVGEKNMNEFLDRVFEAADKEVRGRIIDLAMNKYDRNFRKATEEYLAGLAEDTNFDNPTFLEKVKALLVKLLDKMGIQLGDGLTDNELRYILWKSYRNLVADAESLTEVARDAAMQSALEVGNFEPAVAAESRAMESPENGTEQIYSKNFKRWFGDWENDPENASKVVDEDGKPLVVYHGSPLNFTVFDNTKAEEDDRSSDTPDGTSFFSDNKKIADSYTIDGEGNAVEFNEEKWPAVVVKYKDGHEEVQRYELGGVYSVFLNIRNPFVFDANGVNWDEIEFDGNIVSINDIARFAKEQGYDGAIIKNVIDGAYKNLPKSNIYVTFSPNQIKSATDNNGGFDPDNDDILFRDGEPANKIAGEYNRMTGANVDGVKGVKRGWEEFVRGMMDDMRPLEQMQQLIAKTLGRELRDSEKAYELQTQLTSKVGRQIEREQLDYMVPMLQQVTELMQTLMENNGLSREEAYKRVNNYLLAKHGLERNEWFVKQGKKEKDRAGLRGLAENLGENPDDYKAVAERIVNEFEQQADTKALWKSMKALTDRMLEISYETGMINKDTFEDLMQRHKYYVPLRGFADGTAADMFDYVTQSPHFQNIFQKMRGRQSMADDPLANLMSMLHSAIVIGNQNEVMQKIYNLAVNSNSDLLRITTPWYEYDDTTDTWEEKFPVIPEGATADDIDAIVSQFEADMQQKKAQGKAKRKRNRIDVGKKLLRRQAKEHEMVAYIDGKPVRMYVAGNPLVAQAMNKVNTQHLNKVMQGIQSATRWYSAINTSWSPAFGPKNAMRDIRMMLFGAYTTGGLRKVGRSAKWIAKAGWALPRLLITGKMDGLVKKLGKTDAAKVEQWWNEFLDNGGETGFTRTLNAEKAKGEVKDMIRHMMNGSKDGENRVRKYTIGLLEWIGRYSEDISRFAAYCEYRANGGSVLGSIQEAKNVTVNFNVHGGSDLAANCRALYSFFNASMQGINRMRRLATEHPKRFAAGIAAMMLGGAVLPWLNMAMFALFGGDDDDWRKYEELTEYTANHNMILYVGNHKFISIPWSQELAPFNALGNIWFRQQMGWNKGKSVAEQWGDMFVDLSPISVTSGKKPGVGLVKTIMPSFTTPVWEALFNEDFTGSPLYNDNQWNKYDASWEKAYTGKTSQSVVDASKWLDEKTGIDINPAIAEHLFSGILGGMGRSGDKLLRFFTNGFQLQDAPYIRTMMFDSNPKGYIGAVQREYGRNAYEVLPEMQAKVEKADALEFARLVNTKEYQIANMVSIYKTGKDLTGNKIGNMGIDKMEKEYKKLAGMSDGSEEYREQLEAVRADITEAKMQMLDEIQQVIYEHSGDLRKKEIDYVRGIEERSKEKAK